VKRLLKRPSRFNETPQRVSETVETPKTLAPKPAPEFDWHDADNRQSLVLEEQAETAIYIGKNGHLVIRQKAWPDDDIVVLISPQCIAEFVDKLTDVVGIPTLRG
jgi:hypothetical protein